MIGRPVLRRGLLGALVLHLTLFLGLSHAGPPVWMPSFPLRAGTAVILMWAPVPGASEYKLLKKAGEGDYKELYKGPMNTFNDPDAPATVTIEYKVVPVVGGKDGEASAVATLKGIEALKPPVFTGALPTADAITIRWTNPPGSVFFNLYRAESKDGQYSLLGSVQQDSYTDRKVAKGKAYFYKVTAVDKNNSESAKSAHLESRLEVSQVVAAQNAVIRKPVPRGAFLGEELYELYQPIAAGFAKKGDLFVGDRTSIQFFDKDGKFLRRINFNEKWTAPSGVTLDSDGDFLVAFYAEQLIRKVDNEGKLVWERPYALALGKPKNNPNDVIPGPDGSYWVADGVRFQLIKARKTDDPELKVEQILGRLSGSYDFNSKKETDLPGLAKVVYNPYDKMLYAILPPPAELKVIDPGTGKVVKTLGGLGPSLGTFQGIGGIAFRKNGNILVLDSMMCVVKEFDKDFKYIATYADVVQPTQTKLSLDFPAGMAFREDLNRLYVYTTLGNKVFVFDDVK
jgi:DNA-binding beta-propeller fold protein YncE